MTTVIRSAARLAVLVFLAATCHVCWASRRDVPISQFHHAVWSQKDGAPADVWAIAQTRDGWLWFGGTTGLYRFDGIRFERIPTDSSGTAGTEAVSALFALESGELLIGYQQGGASQLKNGQFTHHRGEPHFARSPVFSFAQDAEGALWAATLRELRRFDGRQWQRIGSEWNFPEAGATNLFVDQAGTLWVACAEGLTRLQRGGRRFERLGLHVGTVGEFIQSPDGRTWLAEQSGVSPLPGQSGTGARSAFTNARSSYGSLVDRDGHHWSLFQPVGEPMNSFDTTVRGLDFSLGLKTIMEDGEGNVWLSAIAGIHRFRHQNVIKAPPIADQPPPPPHGLAVAGDGTVWMASYASFMQASPTDGVWKLDESSPPTRAPEIASATAIHRAVDGSVWIAGRQGVWRHDGGAFRKAMELPDSARGQVARAVTVSANADVWLAVRDGGLFRHRAGTWQRNGGFTQLPAEGPLTIARDASGRLWFGYPDNTVCMLDAERITVLTAKDGLQIGAVTAIGGGLHLLVAGERGLAVLRDGRFLTLETSDAAAVAGAGGVVELGNGDVWLNGAKGAVRISVAAIRAALEQNRPALPVSIDVFGDEDGYPGAGGAESTGSALSRPIVATAEGQRLWVGGTTGVAWIDPARLRTSSAAPRVLVQSLTSNGLQHDPIPGLQLDKGTRSLQVDYTALSYSFPERVRFRYRLAGVDDAWVEAAARRQAFYSNLGPGSYTFLVTATSRGGVESEAPASLAFVIPPTFTESKAFAVLCIAAALGLLVLLYRLRVRQITARARGRLEERLAERERIARELHDTLLQGTQGLILTVQAAAAHIPALDPTRQMLDQALDRANRVMTEGRDRIQDLRTVVESRGELSQSLAMVGDELAKGGPIRFRAVAEDATRDLQPVVMEEAYLVGREALLNAFRHACAHEIEVQIIYDTDRLRVRVRDDGVGLDERSLEAGSHPGHWGLQGMQERAQKVGARLDVWSRPGAGTEIELSVPAAIAYRELEAQSRWRLFWQFEGDGR